MNGDTFANFCIPFNFTARSAVQTMNDKNL